MAKGEAPTQRKEIKMKTFRELENLKNQGAEATDQGPGTLEPPAPFLAIPNSLAPPPRSLKSFSVSV